MPPFLLARFLPYQLSVASNAVSRAVARVYEGRFGLRTPEWRVLAVVAGNADGLLQSELAARTGMDKMTISRAVAGLRGRALIARSVASTDRRTPRLVVTAAGRTVYDDVVPAARAVEAEILAGMDPAAIATLSDFLDRLRVTADRACGEA